MSSELECPYSILYLFYSAINLYWIENIYCSFASTRIEQFFHG